METLEIGTVVCRVKRSDRRSVCFRLAKDGTPEILAPRRVALNKIKELMLPYAERIAAECERQKMMIASRESFLLDYGSTVRFLGTRREIRADGDMKMQIDDEAFYLPSTLSSEEIRTAVVELYKKYAREYISKRVTELSALMGLVPSAVKFNSATSHWASCSRRASLNFSWFCIMASPEAVDYIIVHELCHMHEFNHSKRFWENVAAYCPDYKRHREYLRGLWREILSENWGK